MNKFDYFWNVVSGFDGSAVEITLKDSDWSVAKDFAMKLGCAQYGKSLFIDNKEILKKFILMLKASGVESNTYVGVNPREKIWIVSKGGNLYKSFRGTNIGVQCMKNIFVDVDADRKDPKKAATQDELNNAREVATDVALKLEEVFGIRGHVRLFTGNGYQMFFPLATLVTWQPLKYARVNDEVVYTDYE